MSKFLHGAFHVFMGVLTVAAAASGYIPPPYNLIVAGVNETVRAVVSAVNHKPAGS